MSDDDLTLDDLPQPTDETTVHPDELHVDGDNPNEQSDEMFGLLVENMRSKGWLGNAIVAAVQNDREYIGFEIDEENYRDVIERRIGEAKRQREASVNQED